MTLEQTIILWFIVLIAAIVIEVATLGLTTIWFAGGALVALIAAACGLPVVVQILLFAAISLLLLVFTRPIAMKYFNRDRVRTNVESIVGRQGVVTEEIDNLQAKGHVTVGGQEWTARSVDDAVHIAKDAVVEVTAVSGVKLIVREAANRKETAR